MLAGILVVLGLFANGLHAPLQLVLPPMHFVLIIVINCLSDRYLLSLLKMIEYERMY